MTGWRGKLYTNSQYGKQAQMSGVIWCDKGNHAFSAKDKLRQHFVNTHTVEVLTGNSYGNPTYQPRQEVTEEMDICGPHWLEDNPFTPQEPTAIEAAETEAEQSEADMWKAKYEAEHAKNARPKIVK